MVYINPSASWAEHASSSPSASAPNQPARNPSVWAKEDQEAFLASEQFSYAGISIQAALRRARADERRAESSKKEWLRLFRAGMRE